MHQRLLIPTTVIVLAALGLPACGGKGDDQTKAIRKAVTDAFTTKNAAAKCARFVTASFVTRVYGNVAQCRTAESPSADDVPPTGVDTSGVTVQGDAATVKARLVGGDTDGANGTISMRRQDGTWRVDDLGVDFLRSQVEVGLASSSKAPKVFKDPKVRSCAKDAFLALSDSELRRIAYLSMSKRPAAEAESIKLLGSCLAIPGSGGGSDNVSVLRQNFESGITASARKDGTSAAKIDCINKRLRSRISDAQILAIVANHNKPTATVKRALVRVFAACGFGASASGGQTALRAGFEKGVRRGFGSALPKAKVECVIRRLRSSISDSEIVAATTSATGKRAIQRKGRQAARACAAGG